MATAAHPSRVLLEGDTLHIGFHHAGKAPYPEDIATPAVLRAVAQHMHADLQTEGVFWGDYCYFAGVTGEAFRFLEFMGLGKTQPGRALVERYGHMAAVQMYRCAFAAAGLVAEVLGKARLPAEADLRRRLVDSLSDRRVPVVGFGVFGPPEPFLITGYDEGGDVLLGWSHFQGERKDDPRIAFEPSGPFRLRDWYGALDGVALVTGMTDRPAMRDTYRGALERALLELATTGMAGDTLGTAAMERWAAHLEDDAGFAGWTDAQWQKAHSDHGGTAGDLAERRALAASFLELAVRFLPEVADDLAAARAAFWGAHDTVYEIWETVARTGPFDPDLGKFKDPDRRRTMAALVRRLAAFDRRGLALLTRAVNRSRDTDPGPPVAPDPVLDGTVVLQKAPLPPPGEPRWAPENIALPNAMGMLREFLGEPFGDLNEAEKANGKLDYYLWMGLTGAAFGMLWDGPERANLGLTFDALGYDYDLWLSRSLADATGLSCRVWGWDDNLRRRILWNLRDRRLPVLLFDCGEWPNWWLVTRVEGWSSLQGYGGSRGEGYRPNAPLDHPNNPLRPIDLFAGMEGRQTWTLHVAGRRPGAKPSLDELYGRAVAWGAQKMGGQRMTCLDGSGQEHLSERPYRDWAAMLRTDALFPAGQPETLKARRRWLEGHEVELAERRFYGAGFLDLAARRLGREELRQAAGHFRQVHALMEQVWSHLGGMEAPEAHLRLGERSTREAIAVLLAQIEAQDAAAAALLAAPR